jgi:hypothetical protein
LVEWALERRAGAANMAKAEAARSHFTVGILHILLINWIMHEGRWLQPREAITALLRQFAIGGALIIA